MGFGLGAMGNTRRGGFGSGGALGSAGVSTPPSFQLITATDTAFFAASGCTWPVYGSATTPPNAYFADTNTSWYVWEGWDGISRRFYCKTYNHTTAAWAGPFFVGTSPLVDDDHGVPSIERDSSGYVHLFGGAHASSSMLTFHTNSPNDPSAWTQDTSIAINSAYPKPSFVNSALYLFVRDNTLNNGDQNYCYVKTSALASGVPTWAAKVTCIDYGAAYVSPIDSATGSRVYAGNHEVRGTDIHFLTTFADKNDNYREDVFYYIFDTTTGNIRNFDSSVTVLPASFPIDLATSRTSFRIVDQRSQSHFGNVPSLGFDSNGHPHIGYMDGPSGGPYNFMHTWHDGSAWQTADTVGAFGSLLHRFDGFGVIPLQGGDVDLYWVTPSSFGFTRGGDISKRTWSAGALAAASVVLAARSTYALDGIAPVRYASTSGAALARVGFWEITGDPTAESGRLRGFAYGDSGFVRRPFQTDTNTLVASAGTTTDTDKEAMDELISTFKGNGLWTTSDLYYNFKLPTAAAMRLNWKNPAQWALADVGGGPTFSLNSHVVGNGTSTRLTSGFIPSVNNSAASQNNCGIEVQILNDLANDNYADAGANGGSIVYVNSRVLTGTPAKGGINSTSSAVSTANVASSIGFTSMDRTSSGSVTMAKDGAALGTSIANTSSTVPTGSFDVCGHATAFSARQVRSVWYGSAISVANRGLKRAAERRYNFAHS